MDEKIKVAIVEDDKEMLEGLRTILNMHQGFECISTYGNAEDAIENIHRNIPAIVLMDINLPGISGIECVKVLKPQLPDTQFMMCTVYEDNDSIFESLCAGATGYLLKNSMPSKIYEAIHDLHNGGSPMSPTIARKVISTFKKEEKNLPDANVITKRENEILDLLAKGYRYKEIAELLFISFDTVRTHIHHIYEKLQVQSRTEAINKYYHS
jgi:DNA-binding NarL/FixJ family response regulator